MKPRDNDRFSRLVSWAANHQARLHPEVEIDSDDVTNFSLRVRQAQVGELEETRQLRESGQAVVTCSHTITLSYINALIDGPLPSSSMERSKSPAFPSQFMEDVPPHVIGRFFLIHQYLLGNESHWSPYIESLPQPEHITSWSLPACWPQEDTEIFDGTNLGVAIKVMERNIEKEFKRARKTLKHINYTGWQSYSRLLYNWAFCIFTSRGFRPSLVLSEAVQERLSPILPEGTKIDDFSILLPLLDIANHSPTAQVVWDVETKPAAVVFRSQDTYRPGQQIYNSYGLRSNSELLITYGFIIPVTEKLHNDYLHVMKKEDPAEDNSPASGGSQPSKRDFRVSLRPLRDPSSLVGRSRQFAVDEQGGTIQPGFDLFEDSLLWDLCLSVADEAERAAMLGSIASASVLTVPGTSLQGTIYDERQQKKKTLCQVFSEASRITEFTGLVQRIRELVVAKLIGDYSEFARNELDLDGIEGTLSRNQSLALQFRKQYGSVLINAIRQLDPDVQLEAAV